MSEGGTGSQHSATRERISPGPGHAGTLSSDFQPLDCESYTSVISKPPANDILLQQPGQTKTVTDAPEGGEKEPGICLRDGTPHKDITDAKSPRQDEA